VTGGVVAQGQKMLANNRGVEGRGGMVCWDRATTCWLVTGFLDRWGRGDVVVHFSMFCSLTKG
jgi:hypothetical protein